MRWLALDTVPNMGHWFRAGGYDCLDAARLNRKRRSAGRAPALCIDDLPSGRESLEKYMKMLLFESIAAAFDLQGSERIEQFHPFIC